MINLENYLYSKVLPIIQGWDEKGIYAISFFVYSNEAYSIGELKNLSIFSIGYNTEEDCINAGDFDEEKKWNYAYWRQNNDDNVIIDPYNKVDEGLMFLLNWYKKNGIENIGVEDEENMYDDQYRYIAKGPIGYYELLTAVSNVAKRLQTDGTILKRFGKIPVIVHDLEYTWYTKQATENANPNGEAKEFIDDMTALGCYG